MICDAHRFLCECSSQNKNLAYKLDAILKATLSEFHFKTSSTHANFIHRNQKIERNEQIALSRNGMFCKNQEEVSAVLAFTTLTLLCCSMTHLV